MQPLYSRPVAQASVATRLDFLKKVYLWMTFGVVLSAVGSWLGIQSGIAEWSLRHGIIGPILLAVVWMGAGFFAQKVRHDRGANTIAFGLYGLVTGVVMSSLILVAMIMGQMLTGSAMTYIVQAFGITAVAFGGLSFYAATTKRDLSFMRGMLVVGSIALLGLALVSLFVQSSMFAMAISFFAILLFSGWILFDTQKIVRTYPENEYMAAAIELFSSFAMLFMNILRIILMLAGGRRD